MNTNLNSNSSLAQVDPLSSLLYFLSTIEGVCSKIFSKLKLLLAVARFDHVKSLRKGVDSVWEQTFYVLYVGLLNQSTCLQRAVFL